MDDLYVYLKRYADGLELEIDRLKHTLDRIISCKLHQGRKPSVVIATVISLNTTLSRERIARALHVSSTAIKNFEEIICEKLSIPRRKPRKK